MIILGLTGSIGMEERGVLVDRQLLSRLSGELAQSAAALEDEIYQLAGEKFNIGSPKQLGEILFGKMGLPGGSKTKTGQWSTSAQVLEDLAAEGHAPGKIFFLGAFFIPISLPFTVSMVLAADKFARTLKENPHFVRILDFLMAGIFTAFAVRLLVTEVK